jgi:hypothetical protein
MAERRNPYRPGSLSHARYRSAELNRSRALAEATAARAKDPEKRHRAQKRAARARRGLHQIEARAEYRTALSDRDRAEFNALSLTEQDRLRTVLERYPEHVSPEEPDPFPSRHRGSSWRLYYSTRAGIRRRAAV